MICKFNEFSQVWAIDFEFYQQSPGDIVTPVCMVAKELRSGRLIRLWQDQLVRSRPPFPVGRDVLFVAYGASAETGCFLALDWEKTTTSNSRWLCLLSEFRNLTNGVIPPNGAGLLGAMAWHRLESITVAQKEAMHNLILTQGPYTAQDRIHIIDYCETDTDALARLLPAMKDSIDLPRALIRGEYMACCAKMNHLGVPIDMEKLGLLRKHWRRLHDVLIDEVNFDFGLTYRRRRFREKFFAWWLVQSQIPWPRTKSGRLDLRRETFKERSEKYPEVTRMMDVRATISQMRSGGPLVGPDGRNRYKQGALMARTSRNAPSSTEFIFGGPAWMRGLIKPPPGYGLAYLDYSQQEQGVAAALSGDPLMQEAYLSGDFYMALAVQAGAVPPGATKESHPVQRGVYKELSLAINYGLGVAGIAFKTGKNLVEAKFLLRWHEQRYRRFWQWSNGIVDYASFHGRLETTFGWQRYYREVEPQSMRNFPVQGNAAEILRLATILGFQGGVDILCPVHDALLIQYRAEDRDVTIEAMKAAMVRASEIVLKGFPLRTEATIVDHPNRFTDERGLPMWSLICQLIEKLESGGGDGF